MTPTSDQWVKRLDGDGEAKELAVDELRQLLLQRLQTTFRHRPDLSSDFVEDVTQESLIKILENLIAFEGRSQ